MHLLFAFLLLNIHDSRAALAVLVPIFVLRNGLGLLQFLLHTLILQIVLVELEVGVLFHRLETDPRVCVEEHDARLREEGRHPLVLVRQRVLNEHDDDAGVVDEAHDEDVEGAELSEHHARACNLSADLRRVAHGLEGPHDRQKHRAAADNVHDAERVPPTRPLGVALARLLEHGDADVHDDLQRQQRQEYLLLALWDEGAEETPARAEQQNHGEERDALEREHNVVDVVPEGRLPGPLVCVELGGVEEQTQRLDEQEERHQVVDLVHVHAVLSHCAGPNNEQDQIQQREEKVQHGQVGRADRKVAALVVEDVVL
eukprot:PhM_4_TR15125/c0_g1_i1/m.103824